MMLKYFLVSLIFFFSLWVNSQNKTKKIQRVIELRDSADNENYSLKKRLNFAKEAYSISKIINDDSTLLYSGKTLAFIEVLNGNFEHYKSLNHKNLLLATRLNDTLAQAVATNHLGYYYGVNLKNDSAYYYYYQSSKLFNVLDDRENLADVLISMANLLETEKDYFGSEKNAIDAIRLIQEFPESNQKYIDLWNLNTSLALVSERLERREEALAYYQKCIELSKKIDNSRSYYLNSINNMAYTIESSGDLEKALSLYEEAEREEGLIDIDPELYVVIFGNIGRVKFMMDQANAPEAKTILYESLRISEKSDDDSYKMGIYGFLADIYDKTNQKDSALYYSKKAYEIADYSNSNVEKLAALKLMGRLAGGDEGIGYFNEHIQLSDSLLLKERKARDKFTRIEFETDEIIAEKEQISKERLIFLLASIGLLVTLIFIYIIVTQRSKNKALRYSKMQQEANEEIYNLMLAQQDKVEEGRTDEKKRISKELHDGVLGKLFGTRLSLDSLNLVHTDEAVKNRSKYIEGLQSIETEIRKISHDLSNDFVTGSSFTDIVSTLIETQTKAYQLRYAFDHDDDIDWDAVPNKTKMNIYRMLQETMQNIYKHAQATKIIIDFKLINDLILLTVEDDGIGFNVDRAKKGIGVKNINARAEEMGGYVNIKSKIDSGTLIEISIPKDVNT